MPICIELYFYIDANFIVERIHKHRHVHPSFYA